MRFLLWMRLPLFRLLESDVAFDGDGIGFSNQVALVVRGDLLFLFLAHHGAVGFESI